MPIKPHRIPRHTDTLQHFLYRHPTSHCDLLNNDEPSARLRDLGEKKKFERPRGGTNNVTGVTLTGDQAI